MRFPFMSLSSEPHFPRQSPVIWNAFRFHSGVTCSVSARNAMPSETRFTFAFPITWGAFPSCVLLAWSKFTYWFHVWNAFPCHLHAVWSTFPLSFSWIYAFALHSTVTWNTLPSQLHAIWYAFHSCFPNRLGRISLDVSLLREANFYIEISSP